MQAGADAFCAGYTNRMMETRTPDFLTQFQMTASLWTPTTNLVDHTPRSNISDDLAISVVPSDYFDQRSSTSLRSANFSDQFPAANHHITSTQSRDTRILEWVANVPAVSDQEISREMQQQSDARVREADMVLEEMAARLEQEVVALNRDRTIGKRGGGVTGAFCRHLENLET